MRRPHNLAWKLDAVTRGVAGRALLDTYDAERRPVADRTVAQALARLQAWFKDPSRTLPPPEPIVDDNIVIFGYRYPIGAFIAEGDDESADLFEDPRAPSGRPGSRAPHLIVKRGDDEVSTIDLFAGRWVLCAGPEGQPWARILAGQPVSRSAPSCVSRHRTSRQSAGCQSSLVSRLSCCCRWRGPHPS